MSSLWVDSSSCYPDEPELELGLGLSIGGGGKSKSQQMLAASGVGSWDQYARILTSNDFRSSSPIKASSSSSSCSGSHGTKVHINGYSGTKRAAEEPSSPPGRSAVGQLVGWPPVRTYRINNLSNHGKSLAAEESSSNLLDRYKSQNVMVKKTDLSSNDTRSFFVKVYMDGIPIGRKVDLNAHRCYQTLAWTLDHMFTVSAEAGTRRRALRLSDDVSDFVLTYEDKEGDWMLVGDAPWEVFISSVKRLRIRRAAEANGPPI